MHSVGKTKQIKDGMILQLQKLLDEERAKNKSLEQRISELERSRSFGVDRFNGSPMDFQFYTGPPDYLTFLSFCDFLQPERHPLSSLYYQFKKSRYLIRKFKRS